MIVATNAEIDGDPQVGDTVEVKGLLGPDSTLLALEIEAEDDDKEDGKSDGDDDHKGDEHREKRDHFKLKGVIEGLSGIQGGIASLSEQDLAGQDWSGDVTVTLADGTTLTINKDTEIEGTLRNGVEVEMKIETASDGTRYVTKIEVEDHEEDDNREDHEEEPKAKADDSEKVKQEVRLTATADGGNASGKAKFELRTGDGARIRFSIEVEDLSLAGPLTVKINGNLVGTIILDSGEGELDLDSRDGDDLRAVGKGGMVEVFATDGTTLIFFGTLVDK